MAEEARPATNGDVDRMLDLAEEKREDYKHHASIFHRPAPDARQAQRPCFEELVVNEDVGTLVYDEDGTISGFIIGSLIQAPPVYEPGGMTVLVDDFVVSDRDAWVTVGRALLDAIGEWGRNRGAVQIVVVCGPLDQPKRAMLEAAGHVVASEWWTGTLGG